MLPENQPANPINPIDVVWQPSETLPGIEKAAKGFNISSYETLISRLKAKVVKAPSGITYALLGNDKSSTDEAIVMFCPFANDVAENMLVRGEFVRRAVADELIVDALGRSLPLIVLGSPSGSQGLRLTSSQVRDLNDNLSYFAGVHINFVKEMGFTKINLLGFSQGASVAVAAASEAPRLGLNVQSLAIGDPPNVIARSVARLLRDFASENKYLEADVRGSGIDANVKAHKLDLEGFKGKIAPYLEIVKYAVAILRKRKINLALARQLGKDDFAGRLADLLQTNPDYRPVVAYGSESVVTPKEPLVGAIERTILGFGRGHVELIEVDGAHHSWGDNLKLLARLCIRGFGR